MTSSHVQRSPESAPATSPTSAAPVQRSARDGLRGMDFSAQEGALQPVQMDRTSAAPAAPAAQNAAPATQNAAPAASNTAAPASPNAQAATTNADSAAPAAQNAAPAGSPGAANVTTDQGANAGGTAGANSAAVPRGAQHPRINILELYRPGPALNLSVPATPPGPRRENMAGQLGLTQGALNQSTGAAQTQERAPTVEQVRSASEPAREGTPGDVGRALYAVPEVQRTVQGLVDRATSGTTQQLVGRAAIVLPIAATALGVASHQGVLDGITLPIGPVSADVRWQGEETHVILNLDVGALLQRHGGGH